MSSWHLQPPASSESLLSLRQLLHLASRLELTSSLGPGESWRMELTRKSTSCTFPSGSTSCTCSGKNRAFQHSDGSCLCRTGFIFYDKLDFKSSTADSGLDCQPEVSGCTVWFLENVNTASFLLPPPLVNGRQTKDVPQDRSVWLHPENACHRLSTPATSLAPHTEEAWMQRWAC